ncbi:O-acyltransferase like protein-like [Dermacentor andersoni]|uniref:O-acyltransferase like protein-like n=1 Tax=Dermacentor andersoni TaxID=34620 RepID=UPI003B3BBF39
MLGVLLAMWPVQANGGELPLYASALYSAFSRSIWAACIAWILVCCLEGYGGPVNALLSCKSLVPLSRLTFAAYIVHMVPIMVFIESQQHSFDFSIYLVYAFYFGNLALTYLLALVVCLLFEAPIFSIEKILLAGRM